MRSAPSRSMSAGRLGALAAMSAFFTAMSAWAAEIFSPEEEAELRKKEARPILDVLPKTLTTTIERGGTATLALSVRNAGGQVLRWSVSFAPTWAKAVPDRGELGHGEKVEVVLAIDALTLPPGTIRGDLVLTAEGADGSPAKVALSLQVKPPAAQTAQPSSPSSARKFKFSLGAGATGMDGILRRSTDPDTYSAGLQIFAMGFQFGSWEFCLGGNPGNSDGGRNQYSPTQWFEWRLEDDGPFLVIKKFWRAPIGWRPFVQAGRYPFHFEVYTEDGSRLMDTAYWGIGAGLRWALKHGYLEFSFDKLSGGEGSVEEPHTIGIGWPPVWSFEGDVSRFTALAGFTF